MMSEPERPERGAEVTRMLHAVARTERAPASLRAEVDALRVQAAGGRRVRPPALRGLALRYVSLATTAVGAAVVALVLALGGGGGLSIAEAASLATRGSTAPAPAPDAQAPRTLLATRVGELHFPNWEVPQGWRSTGQRIDHVDGRAVATVYYAKNGHRLAYSIVAAPALSGLHTDLAPYASMLQHGRTVVVWQEHNHTCVLSAAGISAASLWRLVVSSATV